MPITNLTTQIQEVERQILETSRKLKAQQKLRRTLLKAIECANQAGLSLFDQPSSSRD